MTALLFPQGVSLGGPHAQAKQLLVLFVFLSLHSALHLSGGQGKSGVFLHVPGARPQGRRGYTDGFLWVDVCMYVCMLDLLVSSISTIARNTNKIVIIISSGGGSICKQC